MNKKNHTFRFSFCLAFLFLLCLGLTNNFYLFAQDGYSQIIQKVSKLTKERQFDQAIGIIADSIKSSPKSDKLWFILALVETANNNELAALEALYITRIINPTFDGLERKITQLEAHITRSNLIADVDAPDFLSLINKANTTLKMQINRNKYTLFINEILKDRTILAFERKELTSGYAFFTDLNNDIDDEERQYYKSLFMFFSGYYNEAKELMVNYLAGNANSHNAALVRTLLDEIYQLERASIATPKIAAAIVSKPTKNKTPEDLIAESDDSTQPHPKFHIPISYMSSDYDGRFGAMSADDFYNEAVEIYQKNPEDAANLLNIALRRGTPKPEYLMTLGELYLFRLKQKNKALTTFKRLVLLFPNSNFADKANEILYQSQ